MTPTLRRLLTPLALLAATPALAADAPRLGRPAAAVTFTAADGKPRTLADLKGKPVVVVFLSFECPVSNSYATALADLHSRYSPRGVKFLAACPGEEDAGRCEKLAREFRLPFPAYPDPTGAAARALGATVTPEAFVLDAGHVVRYAGRIDNGWAARLKKAVRVVPRDDLREAIDDVLDGRDVKVARAEPVGCPIDPVRATAATGPVTYYKDVLPVLQAQCQTCHRPGGVGPFALTTYKQAVNWASDIKDYTTSRRMPPWKPTDGVPFHGERRLSDKDVALLAAWADGGTPAGDPKDAPTPVKFTDGWTLGREPDLVLTVEDDFLIGPTGEDHFRCFVMPTGLTEDKYVVAVEVKPGNARVVHHSLNFFDTTGTARELARKERLREKKASEPDRGPGYTSAMGIGFRPTATDPRKPPIGGLGGWAPGQVTRELPGGTGYYLPAGSDIVLQIHYHRTGRPESDRTRIGLYFAKKPVERPYKTITVPGRVLFIPAGSENFNVSGTVWVEDDCTIYSVVPHMHLIGKKVKVTMTPPAGKTTTLVGINEWDYNWQETYFFKTPIAVKAGTRFDIAAVYDNSAKNPNNPRNPPGMVFFGEQTTNEMLFGFIGATSDKPGRIRVSRTPPAGTETAPR
jgi:peroxiredoxin/mono/diheme cytochrome c family protein